MIPLIVCGSAYGPRFLPRGSAVISTQPALRVMTWNLRYDNPNSADLINVMLSSQADIIAVQELGTAIAPSLASALRPFYPYQRLAPRATPDGFGIFSRYPIREAHGPYLGMTTCRCQHVIIQLPQQRIALLNAHPHTPVTQFMTIGPVKLPRDFSTAQQDPTIQALLERLDQIHDPVLVVGDFNTAESQPNYMLLQQRLGDAFGETGWGLGWTYPVSGTLGPFPGTPVMRLDYIFHSTEWNAQTAWTGQGSSSDHRYVIAELALAPQAAGNEP